MQRDKQYKNPETLKKKNTGYCLETFIKSSNYCRYGRKCKYWHDIGFQKLNKFGVCKFELKAKWSYKNSDTCKWSHQIRKPLYNEKTAASDASPCYTTFSQRTLRSKQYFYDNLSQYSNKSN